MATTAYCSSEYIERTSTGNCGNSIRSDSRASRPLRPAMLTSIRTRSSSCLRILSSASVLLDASSTTEMSFSSEKRRLSPERKIVWSSTMSTLIMSLNSLMHQGSKQAKPGASSRIVPDLQDPADLPCSLRHAKETDGCHCLRLHVD